MSQCQSGIVNKSEILSFKEDLFWHRLAFYQKSQYFFLLNLYFYKAFTFLQFFLKYLTKISKTKQPLTHVFWGNSLAHFTPHIHPLIFGHRAQTGIQPQFFDFKYYCKDLSELALHSKDTNPNCSHPAELTTLYLHKHVYNCNISLKRLKFHNNIFLINRDKMV